ncbi:ATP-binding protein [Nonomuraea sp. NPDC050404]|uniref:ATP-binding protein n=1 Tax=Nonomuraea sp. NPDC050404 TaxID=3155783 RepID=UPI0033F0E78A
MDSARSRDRGGAGLGLSLVGAIVAAHHGSVQVRRASLGGACFAVRLPLRERV